MIKKYVVYVANDELNFDTESYEFCTFVCAYAFYLRRKNKQLCVELDKRLCCDELKQLAIQYNGIKSSWEF